MNKKILFFATVDFHFKAFHMPYMKWFQDQGWEVHVAANGELVLPYVNERFNIPIQRSPLNRANITAYKELKQLINSNNYDIIHCHTPMGGVLARLAARDSRLKGTKVIYTAHGFHFCKGAPLKNWILYYPIEKLLARITDCLITINQEDYNLAKKHEFKSKEIKHVHGVGVDTDLFSPVSDKEKMLLKSNYGFNERDFLLFYAAEINKNKNQKFLILSLASVINEIPNVKLLLAGDGPQLEEYKQLASNLGVSQNILFLGYRADIHKLLKICDIAVASSLREGLPVNILEAMSSGLPVLATSNRGHSELIQENKNGYIVPPNDTELFCKRLKELVDSVDLRNKLGKEARKMVIGYSQVQVKFELAEIYSKYMVVDRNEAKSKYYSAYL